MEVNLGLGIVSGRQEAQPDNKEKHPGSWGGASPPLGPWIWTTMTGRGLDRSVGNYKR